MTPSTDAVALTESIARYATDPLTEVPDEVLEIARRSLVDTVGVIIAGRQEPAVTILAATVPHPAGRATVVYDGSRTDPVTAALLNGTAGHALDLDDVNDLTYGHPSVVLWPTVLAVAEDLGCSGGEMLEAYLVGFQVEAALALGMDVREHYGRGWHSTATIGVVAAAAAAARLMRLDVATTRRALGLAASMAGGSRQNFGSMTKPLHPGLAARDGVFAARLASRGFTADTSIIEAPLGYYSMLANGVDVAAAADGLRNGWAVVDYGINVKKYPCCFNTHRTADATLDLRSRHGIDPSAVTGVDLTLEPGGFDPLIHHRPKTGLQGKFSAEYVIAAALLDGEVTLDSFTDGSVNRPTAQALISNVRWHEAAVPPVGDAQWSHAYSVVRVTTHSDDVVLRCDLPRGDRRLPLTRAELEAKFISCVDFSGTGWDSRALLDGIWGLADVQKFTGLCTGQMASVGAE